MKQNLAILILVILAIVIIVSIFYIIWQMVAKGYLFPVLGGIAAAAAIAWAIETIFPHPAKRTND